MSLRIWIESGGPKIKYCLYIQMVYYRKRKGTRRPRARRGYKKTGGKGFGYRGAIARQIQPAVPRPLSTQMVRLCYKNAIQVKPVIIAGTQPCLGFTIAVNRPHNLFPKSVMVGSPSEIWMNALGGNQAAMPHLATWSALYNRYLVRGCKVSITFRTGGNSVSTDRGGKIVLVRHGELDYIKQTTTWNSLQNNSQYQRVGNITSSTTTMNQVALSMGYSPSRSGAIKKSALTANPDYQGDITTPLTPTAPKIDEFISCCYVSPFQAATTGAFAMPEGVIEVEIEQVVQFLDPKQNTQQQPMFGTRSTSGGEGM